jgi:hypothetical protein
MSRPGDIALRFANDDDLVAFESNLDDGMGNGIWPRTDRTNNFIRSWDAHHQKAMNHLSRSLRSRRGTGEPLELGRLDQRSKDRLREPSACLALHYLFMAADNTDGEGYLAKRASYYLDVGLGMIDTESMSLDYDADNSGSVDETEKNRPMPTRFIRG